VYLYFDQRMFSLIICQCVSYHGYKFTCLAKPGLCWSFIHLVYLHPSCLPTSILFTFIHLVYLHPSCLPTSILFTFIHLVYLHPSCLPTSILFTFIHIVFLHPSCLPTSILLNFIHFHKLNAFSYCSSGRKSTRRSLKS